ncbi:ankyrin [Artomyces pyxidatus]|uniref:Ankyrin n=1 Tax=Artomyces pyxidatus TaxID=48021 RepID=A0ACB8TH98_9AGAM|nr:ankyrin [Artomyces pyxidatus]
MASYTSSSAFDEAASYLSNASSLSQVSSSVKLELYGLFKSLTVSPTPNTSRPSFFDMTARAKWDAWALAGKDYGERLADAEKKYLEIARTLGWKEGAIPGVADETDETVDGHSGGGVGLGNSVSVMSAPDEESASSSHLHDLAVRDDAQLLSDFLNGKSDPEIDVNAKDEYGYTALHLASDRGNRAAVEVLLKAGADKSQQDVDGYTAVELAKIAGHSDIVALLEGS